MSRIERQIGATLDLSLLVIQRATFNIEVSGTGNKSALVSQRLTCRGEGDIPRRLQFTVTVVQRLTVESQPAIACDLPLAVVQFTGAE